MEKIIVGFDIGTNSIGWAAVDMEVSLNGKVAYRSILGAGSRIVPMDAQMLGKYEAGNKVSKMADRRKKRGYRRGLERKKERRNRLHVVLRLLGFLPEDYAIGLSEYGHFKEGMVPEINNIVDDSGARRFRFEASYQEMREKSMALVNERSPLFPILPKNWTLYYLREKALTAPISREELAWVLMSFLPKRGFQASRAVKSETENNDRQEYISAKVTEVVELEGKRSKNKQWQIVLEGGLSLVKAAAMKPLEAGEVKDFIVITQLDEDGDPVLKNGQMIQKVRFPNPDDWTLQRLKTESDIEKRHMTVGQYIFHYLIEHPLEKVRGSVVHTVDRTLYEKELRMILESQARFHPELRDAGLYQKAIHTLYKSNVDHRRAIANRDLIYLIQDDILMYQRPLKSKKSLIQDCPMEFRHYVDHGEKVTKALKCIARSHPDYQEFRLWSWIRNLRVYKTEFDQNGAELPLKEVTDQLLGNHEDYASLFAQLNDREKIGETDLLKLLGIRSKEALKLYSWNYDKQKSYPCNPLRGKIQKWITKNKVKDFELSREIEMAIWDLSYGIMNPDEYSKAIERLSRKFGFPDGLAGYLTTLPRLEEGYGAYSGKAIRKLLPLMREGRYWFKDAIDEVTRKRIEHLITGEVDDMLKPRTRELTECLRNITDFQGLRVDLACQVVYGRSSEASDLTKWDSPEDIDRFLSTFKQNTMRNPVVEQIVQETLRVARDIWKEYGRIDEIHVELGRSLKAPAEERAEMQRTQWENEAANIRARIVLEEMFKANKISELQRDSLRCKEKYRIVEDSILRASSREEAEYMRIAREMGSGKHPSSRDIEKYLHWIEQRYKSPYTGEVIPVSRLFTNDYEIEHVIPRSRYYDDSFSNKVITETAVNKLKDNLLGYEFIKKMNGKEVELGNGKRVRILSPDAYVNNVNDTYATDPSKKRKLLMEDIPASFAQRQMNDTRYISRYILGLFSRIVREENELEAISKNVIACSGKVTSRLKSDWHLNDVWDDIILPRFERMNEIQNTNEFTKLGKNNRIVPNMPVQYAKGFEKKRIDHRHHALDAIVIACATRKHINLISNINAGNDNQMRYSLSRELCRLEETVYTKDGKTVRRKVPKEFLMPWDTFPRDVRECLTRIVPSFKSTLRIYQKSSNRYQKYVDGKKCLVSQEKGNQRSVRNSMHQESIYGEINVQVTEYVNLKNALNNLEWITDRELNMLIQGLLKQGFSEKKIKKYFTDHKDEWPEVDSGKIKIRYPAIKKDDRYFGKRDLIDPSFKKAKIIANMDDSAIQKILLAHLKKYDDNNELAFAPEGLTDLNKNIQLLNDGKKHMPIKSVRVIEKGEKTQLGQEFPKNKQFVENAKGGNCFLAIYEDASIDPETGKTSVSRRFRVIQMREVIDKINNREPIDSKAKYLLKCNDIVYVPKKDERIDSVSKIDKTRLYRFVSADFQHVYFVPLTMAAILVKGVELNSANKTQQPTFDPEIKIWEVCTPVTVDRLGKIHLK